MTALLLLVGVFLAGCGERPTTNPEWDFSAIDAFWDVRDALAADREPSAAEWAALLDAPGYQALTRSEFNDEFFQRSFRLSFMPSRRDELEAALADEREARFLSHYIEVSRRREELDRHLATLRSAGGVESTLRRTEEFLPGLEEAGYPPVAFVIFANDGRGYDPIVIDLLASVSWDFESFLAHEFHHWYRNRLRVVDFDQVEPSDVELLWTLDQIQAEGLADQIDKRAWLREGASPPPRSERYVTNYRRHLEETPELLGKLDSLLTQYPGSPDTRAEIGTQVAELVPQSGHPTGFFMAELIEKQLGRDTMLQDIGDPFAFVQRFNKAATQAGQPELSFSPEAMTVLGDLEKKYVRS